MQCKCDKRYSIILKLLRQKKTLKYSLKQKKNHMRHWKLKQRKVIILCKINKEDVSFKIFLRDAGDLRTRI